MIIDHDAIVLNNAINTMFTNAIIEMIPGIMASAVPGVTWSASACLVDGERAFRIVGRFTEADGEILEGEFVISQRVILDGDGAGAGWVGRCKATVRGQMRV